MVVRFESLFLFQKKVVFLNFQPFSNYCFLCFCLRSIHSIDCWNQSCSIKGCCVFIIEEETGLVGKVLLAAMSDRKKWKEDFVNASLNRWIKSSQVLSWFSRLFHFVLFYAYGLYLFWSSYRAAPWLRAVILFFVCGMF